MDDKQNITVKQARVIPYLLSARSIKEGCKRAQISKGAVYGWMKEKTFCEELKRQRDVVIERALDTLKTNITVAVATLVNHLASRRENISIRAAERIIEFAQKSIEHEDLKRRIDALEAKQQLKHGGKRG